MMRSREQRGVQYMESREQREVHFMQSREQREVQYMVRRREQRSTVYGELDGELAGISQGKKVLLWGGQCCESIWWTL